MNKYTSILVAASVVGLIGTTSLFAQQLGQLNGRRLILNDGGPATTTKNTITLEPPAAATLTANYTLVFPGPTPAANQILQVASLAGTTATLQWTTLSGGQIFEQETAGNGNIRRNTAYTSLLATGVGNYAFDAQGQRTLATQTASGANSGILSGANNTASAQYSLVGGGNTNTASALYALVLGGQTNTASATYTSVLGGSGNTASGSYSMIGGQSNSISGTNSFVFGYGAVVTQNNTIVFNHPTAGDGTTRVGIDASDPSLALDVDGGIAVRPAAAVVVAGDGQTVATTNRSYIVLNPTTFNRLNLLLGAGSQTGQVLIFRVLETATGSITMQDNVVAPNNTNLTGDWVGAADDTITLIWSGARWVELTRSNN